MPTYTFKRTDGVVLTRRMSFVDYEAVKAGTKQITDDGLNLEIVFNPGTVGFVMKDGVSGGWASKTEKEKKYRAGRNVQMARREKDHVFKSRLIPNYAGEEAHNWSEVQDHVRSTKGALAASTYDPLVTKEKAT